MQQTEQPAGAQPDKTMEQRRAAAILERVHALPQEEARKTERDHYARLVRRLPAMILTNGLGQALAFMHVQAAPPSQGPSNDSRAAQRVIDDLTHLLIETRGLYPRGQGLLLERIVSGDREQLRQATDEALAVLSWWTKFVRAFVSTEND